MAGYEACDCGARKTRGASRCRTCEQAARARGKDSGEAGHYWETDDSRYGVLCISGFTTGSADPRNGKHGFDFWVVDSYDMAREVAHFAVQGTRLAERNVRRRREQAIAEATRLNREDAGALAAA